MAGKVENSGLAVNYYRVLVEVPNQADRSYIAECSDIIEALGMNFNEGEIFKAVWRRAAQRTLGIGKEGNTSIRDAEKMAHFSQRELILSKHEDSTK